MAGRAELAEPAYRAQLQLLDMYLDRIQSVYRELEREGGLSHNELSQLKVLMQGTDKCMTLTTHRHHHRRLGGD